jgi:Deacetylase PdaC/Protein of unknown function (DUF3298)
MMLVMKSFLLMLSFIATFAFSQDLSYQRFYYLGTVGEESVQLELTLNGNQAIGSYSYDIIGTPIDLRGSREGEETDTGLPYTIQEFDGDGKAVARFEGELSSSSLEFGSTFTGTWTGDNGLTLPFNLQRVAEFAKATFQQNRIESSVHYPVFTDELAGFNNVVDQQGQISSILKDFEQGQSIQKDNELYNAWTIYADHTITYASSSLLSMLETIESYTGGAHGNLGFAGHTFLKEETGVRRLELRDLFTDNADLEPMVEFITRDLTAQEATFVADGSVTLGENSLFVFTLSPQSITFHFAPYEVGSYAEGPYESVVPFEFVKEILHPELLAEFNQQ